MNKDRLVQGAWAVVRIAMVVNRVFLIALIAGLTLSVVWPGQFGALMVQPRAGRNFAQVVHGLQMLMLVGMAMAVATEVLLRALAAIVATAREGYPFVAENARRLRTVGWALVVLQVVDVPAALAGRLFPSMGSAAPELSFSPGGWIAVLMVFVLSRVFAAGTAMKDDLEGTV